MRIVFVNRIAWPDEGATALYLTDVAEAAAAAGHEVHVLCGEASYRPGSDASRRPPTTRRGVRYHRVPGRRGHGTLDRATASLAFLARVGWRLLRVPRPDVLVALTDPPFVDVVASTVARMRGARTIHWLMDVYPDVAVAAGVIRKDSPLERALGAVMAASLRRARCVVVLGRSMRRPILARGVPRRRIRVIENWAPAEVEAVARLPAPPRPSRPLTFMYSGNYGVAHDLTPLLKALGTLPANAPIRLILQATGSRAKELGAATASLSVDVERRSAVARADLAQSLRSADIHVVSVRQGYERLLVPSKVYASLALGIPIAVVGSVASEPARLVRRLHAGWTWTDEHEVAEGLRALLGVSGSRSPHTYAPEAARGRRLAHWIALIRSSTMSGLRPDFRARRSS